MPTINETIVACLAAWNETGAERRRVLIGRAWAENGRYWTRTAPGRGTPPSTP